MNHPQPISTRHPLLLGASKGRSAVPSYSAPATLDHEQTYGPSCIRGGMLLGLCPVHAPVRVKSVRGWGVSLQRTSRRLGSNLDGGPFSINSIIKVTSLADAYSPRRDLFNDRPELSESHSEKTPFGYGINRSEGAVAIVQNTVGEIRNV